MLFTCCSYSAVGPNADHLDVMRTGGVSGGYEEPDETPNEEETTQNDDSFEEQPEEVEKHFADGELGLVDDQNNDENNEQAYDEEGYNETEEDEDW